MVGFGLTLGETNQSWSSIARVCRNPHKLGGKLPSPAEQFGRPKQKLMQITPNLVDPSQIWSSTTPHWSKSNQPSLAETNRRCAEFSVTLAEHGEPLAEHSSNLSSSAQSWAKQANSGRAIRPSAMQIGWCRPEVVRTLPKFGSAQIVQASLLLIVGGSSPTTDNRRANPEETDTTFFALSMRRPEGLDALKPTEPAASCNRSHSDRDQAARRRSDMAQ